MKKKEIKKLVLSKETVTNLESSVMNDVKGGYITAHCDTDGVDCTVGCPSYPVYLCD
jgi:natural product precursor